MRHSASISSLIFVGFMEQVYTAQFLKCVFARGIDKHAEGKGRPFEKKTKTTQSRQKNRRKGKHMTYKLSTEEINLLNKGQNLILELCDEKTSECKIFVREDPAGLPTARELVEEIDKTFDELTGGFFTKFLLLSPCDFKTEKPTEDMVAAGRWDLAENYLLEWQAIYKGLIDAREGNLYELFPKRFTPKVRTVGVRTYYCFANLRHELEGGLPSLAEKIRNAPRLL